VRVALSRDPGRDPAGWRIRRLDDAGRVLPGATGAVEAVPDGELAAAVARVEYAERPRWVWEDSSAVYGRLLRSGVRVARSHDLALVEALLLGQDGRWGEPCSLAAARARQTGAPVPDDPPHGAAADPDGEQTLFGLDPHTGPGYPGPDRLEALIDVHARQLERITLAATTSPGFHLLVAAESAAGLAAAEMGHVGLPWRTDVHDDLLAEALGPRACRHWPSRSPGPWRLRA
jgi:DNA polymerase-1